MGLLGAVQETLLPLNLRTSPEIAHIPSLHKSCALEMLYFKLYLHNLSKSLMQLLEKNHKNHLQTCNAMRKEQKYVKMLMLLGWEWLICLHDMILGILNYLETRSCF